MAAVLLRVLDLFSLPLRWLGVDPPQLKAILKVRFLLDDRRSRTGFQQSTGRGSTSNLKQIVFVYLMFGLFMAMMLVALDSLFLALTIVYGFQLAVLGLALVADLRTVLIDTADLPILRPRPIDGRTLLAARILHLFFYLGLLGLSLGAGSIVVGTLKFGPLFPLPFIAGIFATILFAFAAVQFLYSTGMEVLGSERFREMVAYLQAGLTVLMIGLYLAISQLLEVDLSKVLTLEAQPWLYFVPPAWLAGLVLAGTGNGTAGAWTLALTAVGAVVCSLVLLFRVAGPRFDRQLDRLEFGGDTRVPLSDGGASNRRTAERPEKGARSGKLDNWLLGLVVRDPQERAAFDLTSVLIRRDRNFRIRTLPTFGLILVYAAWFLFKSDKGIAETISELPGSNRHLFVLYMVQFFMITPIMNLRFGVNWKAAWVYQALPFGRPGLVLMGAFEAVVARLVLPLYAIVGLGIVLPVWGPRVIPDILFAGIAGVLLLLLMSHVLGLRYPFASEFSAKEVSGRSGAVFLLMFLPVVVGLFHGLVASRLPLAVWPATILLLPVVYLGGRTYRATTEQKMRLAS